MLTYVNIYLIALPKISYSFYYWRCLICLLYL